MSLLFRRAPASSHFPASAPLRGRAWGAPVTPGGLRLARTAYVAAFASGWFLFALAPLVLVGPGLGPLRVPGMLAGVALAGAATAALARVLRCPWRDSLLLGLLAVIVFPVPLLLLTRRYRQVRRASFAPLN